MKRFHESQNVVKNYAKYRPKYSDQVAKCIMSFCWDHLQRIKQVNFSSTLDLMVDVGCGSGQSTSIFQPYFKKILGFDISPEQVIKAKNQNKHENIHYMEGCAEKIAVQDNSVDLVLAGMAAHWFDMPKFYQEVKRILKPNNGCLATIGYPTPSINLLSSPNDELEQKSYYIIKKFLDTCAADRPGIETAYQHVHTRYAAIWLQFVLKRIMTSTDVYRDYITTQLNKLKIDGHEITEEITAKIDPINQLAEDLLSLWGLNNKQRDDILFKQSFNSIVLLAVHSNDC